MAVFRRREITEAILLKILMHELRPGESIPEEALAEEFRVSRTPIREALSALEYSGFVSSEVGKGARALSKSVDSIRNFFDAAGPIYSATYRLVAVQRSDVDLALAEHNLEQIRTLTDTGKILERVLAYRAFMADLAGASNNPFLTDAALRLIDFHIFLKSDVAASLPETELIALGRDAERHYTRIFECVQNSDPDGTAAAVTCRLISSKAFLFSKLFGDGLMAANDG